MQIKTLDQLERSLKKLKSSWSKPIPKKVGVLFDDTRQLVQNLKNGFPKQEGETKQNYFNFVDLVHQVLKTHDLLFLSKQLTYHVVTTSDLPDAYGLSEDALAVLTELLTFYIKRAVFASSVAIHVRHIVPRDGAAIEVRFLCEDKKLSDQDRRKILEGFYSGNSLASSKTLLKRIGGQLWVEFPKEADIALAFHWPALSPAKGSQGVKNGTCKYDIFITDYAKIRQRFGVEKSKKLVEQIETFVKSMVRQPVDMVMAFPEEGLITAIYESQEGGASSVAARISQKLKKETFRLGRKTLNPHFRYQLDFLS